MTIISRGVVLRRDKKIALAGTHTVSIINERKIKRTNQGTTSRERLKLLIQISFVQCKWQRLKMISLEIEQKHTLIDDAQEEI